MKQISSEAQTYGSPVLYTGSIDAFQTGGDYSPIVKELISEYSNDVQKLHVLMKSEHRPLADVQCEFQNLRRSNSLGDREVIEISNNPRSRMDLRQRQDKFDYAKAEETKEKITKRRREEVKEEEEEKEEEEDEDESLFGSAGTNSIEYCLDI